MSSNGHTNGNGAGPHVTYADPPSADPQWWIGFFAATIQEALAESTGEARVRLREAMRRFEESALCTADLRAALGAKPRSVTAPLNDKYDIAADWKPCGNPECRMPIPRRSPKLYCDQLCRHIAEQYAAEADERGSQQDDIPF